MPDVESCAAIGGDGAQAPDGKSPQAEQAGQLCFGGYRLFVFEPENILGLIGAVGVAGVRVIAVVGIDYLAAGGKTGADGVIGWPVRRIVDDGAVLQLPLYRIHGDA